MGCLGAFPAVVVGGVSGRAWGWNGGWVMAFRARLEKAEALFLLVVWAMVSPLMASGRVRRMAWTSALSGKIRSLVSRWT